jgi:magnesium chelatase subunit I
VQFKKYVKETGSKKSYTRVLTSLQLMVIGQHLTQSARKKTQMNSAFPFSAIVGQDDMKLALTLTAIDPKIGGVLAFGDRGTGKSTAIRALADLLPKVDVVKGCPVNSEQMDQVPDWVKTIQSTIISINTPVVDLPLGVSADRVTGALDIERALVDGVKEFQPGLLAKANRGYLYIDEVNLLEDHIVDLLLDVAQSGINTVEKEGLSITHPSRFILIGSGNPEEGELRPQLLDRFGLSVEVRTPQTIMDRVDVIKRRDEFDRDPEAYCNKWAAENAKVRNIILEGRERLGSVKMSDQMLEICAEICVAMGSDGLRGELTLLKTARAFAALQGDLTVHNDHIKRIAPMALSHRLRRDPLDDTGSTVRVERTLNAVLV